MLPLKITDSATDAAYETFDPELSRALADLMPEGYLDRDRLAGRLEMLQCDRKEAEREERETVTAVEPAAAPIESNDDDSELAPSMEEFEAELFRILSGQESAQE